MSQSPPPTVWERIVEQAHSRPESIALCRSDGSGVISYGELIGAAEALAESLRAQSVNQGSRVVILSDNGPQTYLSVLACARLGAIAVMVDDALPAATVARFCEVTDPAAIIAGGDAEVRASGGETDDLTAHIGSGADDALAMIFTSGTTGEPKAVLLPNRTFFAIPDILRTHALGWIDWVAGETTYSPLPATHIGGLWWILNGLMHGASCVTGGEGGASLLELLVDNGVATACLVPTLLTRLVSELKRTGGDIPALRFIAYGGSRAIPADVRFIEAAGVRTAQVYGLSETGCTALCLPSDGESIARIEEGAVGRPYPGVQTFLSGEGSAGPRAGAESASYGTLWIKSPANMLGYWGNPDRTREVLADGWVNTGDLVEQRDDGFFYIRGRSSEMIISGGVNVIPDEVDRIAENISGVREAACYEIPDEEFGARVGLAVVSATDLDSTGTAELKRRIAARYRAESESMARPSTILIVDDIPRTKSGKVMRSSLSAALNGADTRV